MAEQKDSEINQDVQQFINGIISESTHYGWLHYGSDYEVLGKVSPVLEGLGERAHHLASELEEIHEAILEELEERGYDVEA